jgi:RPA family protein
VFIAGAVTATELLEEDIRRMKVNDGTTDGNYFIYAGDYAPGPARMIDAIDPPTSVAVVGKIHVYHPDDGDPLVSVNPEEIVEIENQTRFHWLLETARHTIERVQRFQQSPDTGEMQLAREEYGDDIDVERFHQVACEALHIIIDG